MQAIPAHLPTKDLAGMANFDIWSHSTVRRDHCICNALDTRVVDGDGHICMDLVSSQDNELVVDAHTDP